MPAYYQNLRQAARRRTICGMTYWLIIFLVVAASANQAVLVLLLLLLLWGRAGGPVHQRAGSCVGSWRALWVSPASSWGSPGSPRCLSGLESSTSVKTQSSGMAQFTLKVSLCKQQIQCLLLKWNYRRGSRHRQPSWEESRYFVQLCHELCKL